MAESFSFIWMSCISDSLIRDVLRRSRSNCAACQSDMSAPALHKHEILSLLEKIQEHFEETRLYMIGIIPKLYDQFQHLLPHSPDLVKDKETYQESAKYFLLSATANSIFYGQYITGVTDQITREAFKPVRRCKRPRKSPQLDQSCPKTDFPQNEVSQSCPKIDLPKNEVGQSCPKSDFDQLCEDLQLATADMVDINTQLL